MADDIVTRLQQMLDGPVPFVVGREDIRDALNEIEHLRKEVHEERASSKTFETLLLDATDEIDRLQKEINDLRLQLVSLSIPQENAPRVRRTPPATAVRHTLEHSDQVLVNVHNTTECEGAYCTIHNMSDHHMRTFPQSWRIDQGIMERICPHGIGHPDPDNPWTEHDNRWHHGCDGCCTPPQN